MDLYILHYTYGFTRKGKVTAVCTDVQIALTAGQCAGIPTDLCFQCCIQCSVLLDNARIEIILNCIRYIQYVCCNCKQSKTSKAGHFAVGVLAGRKSRRHLILHNKTALDCALESMLYRV